jgi:PAS domain S-box-containing protein
MNPPGSYSLDLSEPYWKGLILTLSLAVILLTVWCLTHGITTIFMHLYYIPIVLLAYRYRWKGFGLAMLLGLAYFTLSTVFASGDLATIEGAGARTLVFIGIAALVAYLSEALVRAHDTLGARTQIQQSIIQNANVLLVSIDTHGRVTEWNTAAEEISGYTLQEVLHKNDIWKKLYPDAVYRKTVTGTITQVIGDNRFFENFETVIRTKSGGNKTISWNTRAIPGEKDAPSGFVAIGIDVTSKKKLETELVSVAHEWEATFDATSDGICLINADQKILRCNRQMTEILGGLPPEAIVGRSCFEIVHETTGPIVDCPFVTAKRTHRRTGSEVNQEGQWFEITADPILDAAGNFAGAVHIMRDITDRKKAEEALVANEKKYRTLFENMLEGFAYCRMIYDADGTPSDWVYLDVNRAFEQLTGIQDIVGKHVIEAIPDIRMLNPELFETYGRVAATGVPESFEIDFKPLGVWLRVSVFSPEKGYFVAAFEDITDRKQVEESLRESEEKFRGIFDMISDGIHIHDVGIDGRPGKFIEVNKVACRMLQYTREELLEHSPLDFVTEYHSRPPEEIFDELISTGHAIFETEHRRKDGTIIPVEVNTNVVTLQGKRVVVSVVRDITERKRVEEVLRQNQIELANAMDIAHLVNWEYDVASGMFRFDDRFYSLFATTAEREGGNLMSAETYSREFVHPDDSALVGEAIWTLLGTDDPNFRGQMEHRIIRRDGEVRTIIARYAPVMDEKGKVVRTFGANQDITEQKRMEDALVESRQLFSDIISFLPDPTFVIDKDGKVLAWNRALEQMSGIPAGDMIGKGEHECSIWMYGKRRPVLIDLVLHPDTDSARLNYTHIHWEGGIVTAQTEISRDGRRIPLSLVASPLIDSRGNTTGAIESMRDISHVKEAEAALERLNANLEMIVRTRTRALEEEVTQRKRAEDEVQGALDYTRSVIEANPDLLVVLDDAGIILDVNAAGEVLSGLPKEKLIGTSYFGYLVEDGTLAGAFSKLLKEGKIENTVHLRRSDGHVTPLSIHATVIAARDGTRNQVIVSAHDITRQKQDEGAIQASLDEQVLLLREVHHRVKNNLQIIISLTNLQMRQTDDPKVKQIMSETQNRVRAMSLVHEKLYRSESLSRIDFGDYSRFLATQLFSYFGMDTRRVRLEFSMEKFMVDIVTAVPLGLLMNELVSNALKHAFPMGKEGTIAISGGMAEDGRMTLIVRDTGIGMPKDLDWKNTTSLGMRLVTSLVDQVDGTITLDLENGTMWTITVKKDPAHGGEQV